MMDFISVPLVVGICIAGVYGLFELFVRKKERLAIIEKIGDKIDASAFGLPAYSGIPRLSFSALKAGCLLTGVGLGLLIGFIIVTSISMSSNMSYMNDSWQGWYRGEITGTVYGASVLLFGGLGLIIAFIVELKIGKRKD